MEQESFVFILASLGAGGAERVVIRLANASAQHRRTHLVVLTREAQALENEICSEVGVHRIGARRVALSLAKLVVLLKELEPKSVLTAVTHVNILGVLACRIARPTIRIVISERNLPRLTERLAPKEVFLRLLKKILYPLADEIVAVSNSVKKSLVNELGLSSSTISVIYNPVPNLARSAATPQEKTVLVPRRSGPTRVLAVGSLTAKKNFLLLIDAVAQLRAERLFFLSICGEGPERRALSLRIKLHKLEQTVKLVGYQNNMQDWFRKADLFVSSSRIEGSPNAILEALAHRVPIVATAAGGSSNEILSGGKCGLIVPDGDLGALVEAIRLGIDGFVPPPSSRCVQEFEEQKIFSAYLSLMSGPIST